MLSKNTQIFASYHPNDETSVMPVLEKIRLAGWQNIYISGERVDRTSVSKIIQQSEMVLVFLSKTYTQNDRSMLEEFAYAATVVRKPFIPIWLDSLAEIQQNVEFDQQLLSTLEMLTAKHTGTAVDTLIAALEQYTLENIPYTPSTPQVCEKPCEAYEGDEPYIFISYAHDDAERVYPTVKELYESGRDLWYDEGIKITERYLPVIADHVKRCAAFVLMLTNRCLERPFVVDYELEYAWQLGVPIIPVLLEEINPPSWARDVSEWLLKNALAPDALHGRISAEALPDRGRREAVPPAIKQNVVYDVVLPPKIPEFEIAVQGYTITLTKYTGKDTNVVIPNKVIAPGGEVVFRVVAIGNGAFSGCKSLTSITIPESVTSIGEYAFSNCKLLTSITIPESVTSIGDGAFYGCRSLTSITIPEGVTSIGNGTFSDCYSLTNIAILEGVTSIGDRAFLDCISLTSITIPEGVTSIGEWAFSVCTSLTSITIPEGVTSIGDKAFSDCKSLTSITIPESIIYIADDAFYNTSLNIPGKGSPDDIQNREPETNGAQAQHCHFEIPQSQEVSRALICCAKDDLQHVHTLLIELYWEGFNIYYEEMPDQKTIEECKCVLAFFSEHTAKSEPAMNTLKQAIQQDASCIIQVFIKDCTNWPNEEIKNKLQDRLAIIESRVLEREFTGKIREVLRQFGCSLEHPRGFEASYIGDYVEIVKFNPTGFSQVIIPKTFFNPPLQVKSIGEAFRDCESLTSITIPEGVTSIGGKAFYGCKSLTSITIPEGVTSIGDYAFWGCKSLTSITIPGGVTSIGERAFSFCKSLTSITISEGVTSIGDYAFWGCKSLTSITIPEGVTSIGERAFWGCKSLTSITIPEGVTSISAHAFIFCESLTSITIPEGVTSIDWSAFEGCKSLTSITIQGNIMSFDDFQFFLDRKS
jgi:hypothetical protein